MIKATFEPTYSRSPQRVFIVVLSDSRAVEVLAKTKFFAARAAEEATKLTATRVGPGRRA